MENQHVSYFAQLFADSVSEQQNCNLAVSNVLLSRLDNETTYIFGGMLRDLISNSKSNDVDIIVQRNNHNFSYDQSKGKFIDSFFDTVISSVFDFGVLTQVTNSKIDNKYGYENTTDLEILENDDQINLFDRESNIFSFRVDHVKYSLNIEISGSNYPFELDVSFVEDMNEFNGFSPACYQDSLFFNTKPLPNMNFDEYVNFLKNNCKTFSSTKTADEIIEDIKSKIVEICDISSAKKCKKISRLLTDKNYKLKFVDENDLESTVRLLTTIIHNEYNDKRIQNKSRNFRKEFHDEYEIYRYLNIYDIPGSVEMFKTMYTNAAT